MKVDAWIRPTLREADYTRLAQAYKLSTSDLGLPDPNYLFERKAIIGHWDFRVIKGKILRKEKFGIVSGLMASGDMHLGTCVVIEQLIYYQQHYNCEIFIPIADIEALTVRKKSREEICQNSHRFLAHFKALGLDLTKCHIYKQSENLDVLVNGLFLARYVKYQDFQQMYGRAVSTSEIISALVMFGDILCPQFRGISTTLVIIGIDEIAHIQFVRRILNVARRDMRYNAPSATFHKVIAGVKKKKMSKSEPDTSILLSDSKTLVKEKVDRFETTPGEPWNCGIYQIFSWVLKINDKLLGSMRNKCQQDALGCPECRAKAIDAISSFLENHQQRYSTVFPILEEFIHE